MHTPGQCPAAPLPQVRGAKYAKLKHEKNKAKKKERAKRAAEVARAEELGLEPPPKPVPKASALHAAVMQRALSKGGGRQVVQAGASWAGTPPRRRCPGAGASGGCASGPAPYCEYCEC